MDASFRAVFVLGNLSRAEDIEPGIGPVFGWKVKWNSRSVRVGLSTGLMRPTWRGAVATNPRDVVTGFLPADRFAVDGFLAATLTPHTTTRIPAVSKPTNNDRLNHSVNAF